MPGLPGVHRDAYPITSPVVGTEQVVVLADHDAVATLSFTLAAPTATDPPPATITAAGIDAFAVRQYRRLVTALAPPAADRPTAVRPVVAGSVLLAVAAVLVVVLAAVLVRRRAVGREVENDLALSDQPVSRSSAPFTSSSGTTRVDRHVQPTVGDTRDVSAIHRTVTSSGSSRPPYPRIVNPLR